MCACCLEGLAADPPPTPVISPLSLKKISMVSLHMIVVCDHHVSVLHSTLTLGVCRHFPAPSPYGFACGGEWESRVELVSRGSCKATPASCGDRVGSVLVISPVLSTGKVSESDLHSAGECERLTRTIHTTSATSQCNCKPHRQPLVCERQREKEWSAVVCLLYCCPLVCWRNANFLRSVSGSGTSHTETMNL